MRKYHNRIKRELFNQAYTDINCSLNSNPTFLDIGSGKGGDTSKLRKYSYGIFVEPDLEFIDELNIRARDAFNQEDVKVATPNNYHEIINDALQDGDRVIILQSGGEKYDLITEVVNLFIGDQVDVVSMMLSLSFFWQNEEIYNLLMETIRKNLKPGGQFIYLTIDGDIVQQAFHPAFRDGIISDKWESPAGEIKYDNKTKQVNIDLKNTIVKNQTEWLVRLDDIDISLTPDNVVMDTRYRADQEEFLSSFGKKLSSLYTYGRFLRLI